MESNGAYSDDRGKLDVGLISESAQQSNDAVAAATNKENRAFMSRSFRLGKDVGSPQANAGNSIRFEPCLEIYQTLRSLALSIIRSHFFSPSRLYAPVAQSAWKSRP